MWCLVVLVKEDEAGLPDSLAALVSEEYVVYNNPKVRRHLLKRR